MSKDEDYSDKFQFDNTISLTNNSFFKKFKIDWSSLALSLDFYLDIYSFLVNVLILLCALDFL